MPDKHNNKIGNNEIGNGFDADLHSYRLVQRNWPCLGKLLQTRPYTASVAIFYILFMIWYLQKEVGLFKNLLVRIITSSLSCNTIMQHHLWTNHEKFVVVSLLCGLTIYSIVQNFGFFFQRHKLENLKQMLTWSICFRIWRGLCFNH